MRKLRKDESQQKIRITKIQRDLLSYVKNNPNGAFSVKGYSKQAKISRSYCYKVLDRLAEEGYIDQQGYGVSLTRKGEGVLGYSVEEVKGTRERTDPGTLSAHYLRYQLDVMDNSKFSKDRLTELNPADISENKLSNYTRYYVKFDDATIQIDQQSFSIRVHDIVTTDVDDAHFQGFQVAKKYIDMLMSVGLHGDNMRMPDGHFARVESHLAKYLHKRFGKYKIELASGKHFWVDNSPPNEVEDETDDDMARSNTDKFMKGVETGAISVTEFKDFRDKIDALMDMQEKGIQFQQETTQQIMALTESVQVVIKTNQSTAKNVLQLSKLVKTTIQAGAPKIPEPLDGTPNYFG